MLRRVGIAAWLILSAADTVPLLSQESLRVGAAAPEFSLKTLAGGTTSLSQYRGRPVLVNFWASWCRPCRAEMPEIIAAYNAHRAAGLEVLAINLTDQERRRDVLRFVEELGIPFPVLLDEKGRVRERYGLIAVPTTLLVDRVGGVRAVHPGPIGQNSLAQGLAAVLPNP